MDITELFTLDTVRIEPTDGQHGWSGTGFFFDFGPTADSSTIPILVTNRHVLQGASTVSLSTRRYINEESYYGLAHRVVFTPNEKLVVFHPDPKVDLAIIVLAPILAQ